MVIPYCGRAVDVSAGALTAAAAAGAVRWRRPVQRRQVSSAVPSLLSSSVSGVIAVWQSRAICALAAASSAPPAPFGRFGFPSGPAAAAVTRHRRTTEVPFGRRPAAAAGFNPDAVQPHRAPVCCARSLDSSTSIDRADAQRPDARSGGAGSLAKRARSARRDVGAMPGARRAATFFSAGAGRTSAEHRQNPGRIPAEAWRVRATQGARSGRTVADPRQKRGRRSGVRRDGVVAPTSTWTTLGAVSSHSATALCTYKV